MENLPKIKELFSVCLQIRNPDKITYEKRDFEEQVRAINQESAKHLNLNEDDIKLLIKHLETIWTTTQEDGHLLVTPFKPWYPQLKKGVDHHYWNRLKNHWERANILPKNVIRKIDEITDELVGVLGNPKDNVSWNRRKGLVMGNVQMGKTTNYSALIAKSADVGYRVIVILSGMSNHLRLQTQIRIDKTFVGKNSLSDRVNNQPYPIINHMKESDYNWQPRYPFCATTQLYDFHTKQAKSNCAGQTTFSEPILFVTKKHSKVLSQITMWLKSLNHNEKLNLPLLLIDDEADLASINTREHPNETTEINKSIRSLLQVSHQSSYIGYTATPFANIFIDPNQTNPEILEDLYPSDFIKHLISPSNYIGPKEIFSDSGLLQKCVEIIKPEDFETLIPLNHKKGHIVNDLPDGLKYAVKEYVIFRAIRIASKSGDSHSAMLVNISRFNEVQNTTKDLIDVFFTTLANGISAWGSSSSWKQSQVMRDLHMIWLSQYQDLVDNRLDWETVRTYLQEATSSIKTKLIIKGSPSIDYDNGPQHIIAIGGLALSRGLTLEGLAVSYVLRNVGAKDTLLQMGRWFGYHDGYQNLLKIHVTQDTADEFKVVCDTIEELTFDFIRMEKLGKTPRDFGIKVKSEGLKLTSNNKMRHSTKISLVGDYSSRLLEAYSFHVNKAPLKHNFDTAITFIKSLKETIEEQNNLQKRALIYKNVSGSSILKFIEDLKLPQREFVRVDDKARSLISDYINERVTDELGVWDIAIPYKQQLEKEEKGLEHPIVPKRYCITRTGAVRLNNTVLKLNKKNSILFGEDLLVCGEDEGMYKMRIKEIQDENKGISLRSASVRARSKPLLLIHFIRIIKPDKTQNVPLDLIDPVIFLSLVLPETSIPAKEKDYIVTDTYIKILSDDSSDTTDIYEEEIEDYD